MTGSNSEAIRRLTKAVYTSKTHATTEASSDMPDSAHDAKKTYMRMLFETRTAAASVIVLLGILAVVVTRWLTAPSVGNEVFPAEDVGQSGYDLQEGGSLLVDRGEAVSDLSREMRSDDSAFPPEATIMGRRRKVSNTEGDLATANTVITVYLTGQVHRPGVLILAAGTRVHEAIEKAGGLTEDANAEAINLARELADGEHIIVPAVGEEARAGSENTPSQNASAIAAGCVDANTADSGQLQTVPGLGPALAQRIIDYRQVNGPFRALADLDAVSGIGAALIERMRDHLCQK